MVVYWGTSDQLIENLNFVFILQTLLWQQFCIQATLAAG